MKIIFIMHDLLTWPQRMMEKLEGHEIILLDNGSTYPPLLQWYETCPHRVIRVSNDGHTSPWKHLQHEMSEPFVVTDPDLDISNLPPDWDQKALLAMALTGETKVGLAIDTAHIPADSPARKRGKPLTPDLVDLNGDLVMGVPLVNLQVDTTFAVYAPNQPYGVYGISLGRPYTVIHLPWHRPPDVEYQYYIDHANRSSQYSTYLKGAPRG